MTFTAYIQRQKNLIRSRREDEQPRREELRDTDRLMGELSSLKGLNTAERIRFSKLFS